MSKLYLLQQPWPPFLHGGQTFDLSHLNEFVFEKGDSAEICRQIIVTFTDHCFTRPPRGAGDIAPAYPNCSRNDGRFCTERYDLSLKIKNIIATARDVWNGTDEHFVIARAVDHRGVQVDYVVIFSIEKVKGLEEIDLHVRVRSAHQRDLSPIATFGSVRFVHLVKLTMEGKKPRKITDHHRKRPRWS